VTYRDKYLFLMRPKFQKRSALKFDGRIIPEAKPSGIIEGLIPHPLGRKFLWIPRCLWRGCSFFIIAVLFFSAFPLYGEVHHEDKPKANTIHEKAGIRKTAYLPMAEPGKKIFIGDGNYIIYRFDKKPKMGTVIMKVEIFHADGGRDTSMKVFADAGMPSMGGAHETGDRSFALSQKGVYLLPINIVMPGDWEIRLTVVKDDKSIFFGRYNFDI